MSYKLLKKKTEGFTIIEVLIVLAIAGLIMLIVFLAVPALQRNQRNNARNSEGSRIAAAVQECLANRNGQVGSCASYANLGITTASTGVAPNVVTTMNGYQQITSITFSSQSPTGTSNAAISYGYACATDGASAVATATQPRNYAVVFELEGGVDRCLGSS